MVFDAKINAFCEPSFSAMENTVIPMVTAFFLCSKTATYTSVYTLLTFYPCDEPLHTVSPVALMDIYNFHLT